MPLHLIELKNTPIFEQLLLEESLLRDHTEDFCLINHGSSAAIVLGISGKKEELVQIEKAASYHIPLIKRFSGGGTVVVDHNTLFVTFIFSKKSHPFPAYPEPIMLWSEDFYRPIFARSDFCLKENDYVLADKKFGGNAQYLKKERWLHHTSFLWDYNPNYMDCLLHPKKSPCYRANRVHHEFICKLSDYYPNLQTVITAIKEHLHTLYPVIIPSTGSFLSQNISRRTTSFL
ncbi:MAG: lipoyl protein ligase domain-containing protein [Candidatus Rhabdochlamydia sp.]|jgi:lipoate-protein ligase A|nr:lipoate---protein ligase [Chlamydiota bacterium]